MYTNKNIVKSLRVRDPATISSLKGFILLKLLLFIKLDIQINFLFMYIFMFLTQSTKTSSRCCLPKRSCFSSSKYASRRWFSKPFVLWTSRDWKNFYNPCFVSSAFWVIILFLFIFKMTLQATILIYFCTISIIETLIMVHS